ncbi:MAG: PspC domain-containing protein [Bacteroidales bacterium]|nr:PspC domain-containing protein [Bacteroidales bacterium]
MNGRRLIRDVYNGKISGVCAGLADYLDIDVTIIRVVFIFMALCGLSGLLLYLIFLIVMPTQ